MNKHEAGEHGERYLLSLFEMNKLPENTVILHNVSFTSNMQTQIDILIISPSWCLILEVKNIRGVVSFNRNPKQLIRIREDGSEENLGSPEVQVEQFQFGLNSLLSSLGIRIPIYCAIIWPFNNAVIKQPPEKYPLLMGREILQYIWSLPRGKNIVNPNHVGKIIMDNLKPWEPFPLCDYYEISKDMILRGVECPNCGTIPMRRTLRTWCCPKCQKNYMYAHTQALKDYYMLISKTITSREAMSFLGLRNRFEAVRIIRANSTNRTGATKTSRFELSLNALKKV
ncbi:nuclease-like protein [Ureibacillus xyleni]|uniref:Nuclease-like protein n=1 Tax=Ureibacillus xyleni TaxID=614648 RepID=A0A285R907_9BACL|nr:nuclease-related domain-containing protein [Ureibacillus xyleni]SOB90238.1 nuclease-like protein [Ureibacillus xyleni]